jgi:hypothetical protein
MDGSKDHHRKSGSFLNKLIYVLVEQEHFVAESYCSGSILFIFQRR